jgi:hypothetical protein
MKYCEIFILLSTKNIALAKIVVFERFILSFQNLKLNRADVSPRTGI